MKNLVNSELFEIVAQNIADDIINFEGSEEELQDYISENFYFTQLDSSNEWVIAWDCEVLFDGFEDENETQDFYYKLDNKIHEIVNNSKNDKVNIIGYYKESTMFIDTESLNFNEKSLYMVVFENGYVDGSKTWLEGYNVIEGHFEIKDKSYLTTCEKITKEQYIEATKGWYTPIEYIQ